MRNYYRNMRNDVIQIFRESDLWARTEILEEDAGLHFVLQLDTKRSDEELKKIWQKKGIYIRSMTDYSKLTNSVKQHLFIINYTSIPLDELPMVLKDMARDL